MSYYPVNMTYAVKSLRRRRKIFWMLNNVMGLRSRPVGFDRGERAMATVRHLGLVPNGCPLTFNPNTFTSGAIPRLWMSLEYAMAVYWRVKNWKVVVVANWQIAGAGTFFLSFSMEKTEISPFKYVREEWDTPVVEGGAFFLVDSLYLGQHPASEIDLVCEAPNLKLLDPAQIALAGNAEFRYFGIGRPATADRMQTNIEITSNVVYNSENQLFAPLIRYRGSTFRWVNISPHPFQAEYSTYGEYGTFYLKMLGETFFCPIFAQNSRGGTNMDISVTLEATEYWPYDPGDGDGPIYDSATGAQLRPFP